MSAKPQSVAHNPARSQESISRGLTWSDAENLASTLGVPVTRLGELLDISAARKTRRKRARLTPQESDRLLRLSQIWTLACEAVGGPEGARSWLARPQHGLNGAVPLDLARSEAGARNVEELLQRILSGVLT